MHSLPDEVLGVVLVDTRSKENQDDDVTVQLIQNEIELLTKCGVTVQEALVPSDGEPPRYKFLFPNDTPSYSVRQRIEHERFDVGQQMGSSMLTFYATRRSKRGSGWEV